LIGPNIWKLRHNQFIFNLGTKLRWVVMSVPRPLYPTTCASFTHYARGWEWVRSRGNLPGIELRFLSSPAVS
jgi:hypothetical protein